MAGIKEKQSNYLQRFWAFNKRMAKETLLHPEQFLVIMVLSFFLQALDVSFMGIVGIMLLFVLYGGLNYSEGLKSGSRIAQEALNEVLKEIEKKVMALPASMDDFLGHISREDKKELTN